MNTFAHKVVEDFIQTMERDGVGLAAQSHTLDKPKAILLDAHRLGLFDDHPVAGIQPPRYDPKRVVLPTVAVGLLPGRGGILLGGAPVFDARSGPGRHAAASPRHLTTAGKQRCSACEAVH